MNTLGREAQGEELRGRNPTAPTTAHEIAHSVGVLFGGRVATVTLQLLGFGVAAAYLGPADLGVLAFAQTVVFLFQFVFSSGFHAVAVREIAQHPDREAAVIPHLVFLRVAVGLLAYAALILFMSITPFSDAQKTAALICGASLPLSAFDSFRSRLEVRLMMGSVSIGSVAQAAAFLGGALLLAYTQRGIRAYAALWAISSCIAYATYALRSRALSPLMWRIDRNQLWSLARAAAPFAISLFLILAYSRLGIIYLALAKPAAEVGQYAVASKFVDALITIPTIIMATMTPILARAFAASQEYFRHNYDRAFDIMFGLSCPLAVGGALTCWRWIPALPGFSDFQDGGIAASILSVALGLIFMNYLHQALLMMAHAQRNLVTSSIVGLVVNVCLVLILVSLFSSAGLAVATTLTETVVAALLGYFVWSRLGLRLRSRRLVRIAAATSLMALALVLTFSLPPFVQLGVGLSSYVTAVLVTRTITRTELVALLKRSPAPATAGPST